MTSVLRPFTNTLQGRFTGRIKPGGIPRIDWTHPLTLALQYFWLDVGGVVIDLVTGDMMTAQGSGSASLIPNPTPYGTANKYQNVAGYLLSRRPVVPQVITSTNYSYVCCCYVFAAAVANSCWFTRGDAAITDQNGFRCGGAGTVTVRFNNAGYGGGAFTPTVPSFNLLAGVATGATASTFYANGTVVGTGTVGTSFTPTVTDFWSFGQGQQSNTGANIFYGAFFNRSLSQAEVTLLYNDPYCFLIPAESELPALRKASAQTLTMNLGAGTYTLTGEQITEKLAAKFTVQSGSYVMTDEQLKLLKAAVVKITTGSYSETGEQVAAKLAAKQTAQSGTFALTPETITFKAAFNQHVTTGTYALTVESVAAKAAYRAAAASGSFALTGENATAKVAVAFKLQSGQFALTGENLKFILGAHQTLNAGFYSLNGQSIVITTARRLTLNLGAGSFALTAEQLALKLSARLSPAAVPYSFTVESEALRAAWRITPTPAAYNLTVEPETLKAAWRVNPVTGQFVLTGETVSLPVARHLSLATGSFALNGQSLTITSSRSTQNLTLNIGAGSFAVTVEPEALKVAWRVNATTGQFSISGKSVSLPIARQLGIASGSFGFTGAPVAFRLSTILSAATTTYSLNGQAVTATYTPAGPHAYTINLGSGSYALTEPALGVVYTNNQPTPPPPVSGGSSGGFGGGGLIGYYYPDGQRQPTFMRPAIRVAYGTGAFGVSGGSLEFTVTRRPPAAFAGLPESVTPTAEEMELLEAVLLIMDQPEPKKLALSEDEEIMLILADEL